VSLNCKNSVDLIGAYSNRRDALVSTVQQLRQAQEHPSEPAYNVRSAPLSTRQWRVKDRLSEADTERLIAAFIAGTPKRKLAERYGISESSVKRLIRQHGASKASCGLSGPGFHRQANLVDPGISDTGSAPRRVVDQTWASGRNISVQRPVGEAGTGEVANRFQRKASTTRAAGSDPLFHIVKISEEVEEGM
jgi:hypothetical protein